MENKEVQGVRINKFISDYGFCSRREADRLISDERVTINNRVATHGDRVTDADTVRIDGEHLAFTPLEQRPKKHRWGPPKSASLPDNEQTSVRNAGQRGAVRHVRKERVVSSVKITKKKKSEKRK